MRIVTFSSKLLITIALMLMVSLYNVVCSANTTILDNNSSDTVSDSNGSRMLIVYFSQPENVDLTGIDGIAGASALTKNNQFLGNNQYVAQLIQQNVGGDLFRIETVNPYPDVHAPLLDFGQNEKQKGIRPEMKLKIENLNDYDTIFIGYPIWWYQMPMVMYSFFEQHDFTGKTIVPFTVHGGSRFSGSIEEIERLQPKANLIKEGLIISRDDVTDEDIPERVITWLKTLPNLSL